MDKGSKASDKLEPVSLPAQQTARFELLIMASGPPTVNLNIPESRLMYTHRGGPLLTLKTIAFVYDAREDRILAAINADAPERWSCWVTRRMTLAWLAKGSEFVAKTSSFAQRTSSESLKELASFEHEAALAQTASSITPTPPNVLDTNRTTAKLLHTVTLDQRGDAFRIEMKGEADLGAVANLKRAELQRITQMLREAATKASWIEQQPQAAASNSVTAVRH